MLVAAAVCPCPPLLVPEVASGAAPELDALREACASAVRALIETGPDLVAVVGAGKGTRVHEAGAVGSFRAYGVPVDVRLGEAGAAAADPSLPLSLSVGAWLLQQAAWRGPVRGLEVAEDADWPTNGESGVHAAQWAARVALLVMGDGSARRSVRAPGYFDERAVGLDARIAAALADNDADGTLAKLTPETARDLMASGRSPWQVLSAAAGVRDFDCRLLYDDAPYGVGYFVAAWT